MPNHNFRVGDRVLFNKYTGNRAKGSWASFVSPTESFVITSIDEETIYLDDVHNFCYSYKWLSFANEKSPQGNKLCLDIIL